MTEAGSYLRLTVVSPIKPWTKYKGSFSEGGAKQDQASVSSSNSTSNSTSSSMLTVCNPRQVSPDHPPRFRRVLAVLMLVFSRINAGAFVQCHEPFPRLVAVIISDQHSGVRRRWCWRW